MDKNPPDSKTTAASSNMPPGTNRDFSVPLLPISTRRLVRQAQNGIKELSLAEQSGNECQRRFAFPFAEDRALRATSKFLIFADFVARIETGKLEKPYAHSYR